MQGKVLVAANGAITRSGEPLVQEEERGVFQGETLKCSLSSWNFLFFRWYHLPKHWESWPPSAAGYKVASLPQVSSEKAHQGGQALAMEEEGAYSNIQILTIQFFWKFSSMRSLLAPVISISCRLGTISGTLRIPMVLQSRAGFLSSYLIISLPWDTPSNVEREPFKSAKISVAVQLLSSSPRVMTQGSGGCLVSWRRRFLDWTSQCSIR